jgi:hypothetical protein
MTINKRAIEFHRLAAAALYAAGDAHAAVIDAKDIKQARALAITAHQLGLEAALKSDTAAAATAGAPAAKEWVNPPLPQRAPDPPPKKQEPVEGPDNPRA